MNRRRTGLWIGLLACLACFQSPNAMASPEEAEKRLPLEATVVEFEGEVIVLRPGAEDYVMLRQDDKLPVGTDLTTGLESMVSLSITENIILVIKELTDVRLTEAYMRERAGLEPIPAAHLRLRSGRVRFGVIREDGIEPELRISTPRVTASVRGTTGELDASSDLGDRLFGDDGVFDAGDRLHPELGSQEVSGDRWLELVPDPNSRDTLLLARAVDTLQLDFCAGIQPTGATYYESVVRAQELFELSAPTSSPGELTGGGAVVISESIPPSLTEPPGGGGGPSLVVDDFDRPDNPDIGNGWVEFNPIDWDLIVGRAIAMVPPTTEVTIERVHGHFPIFSYVATFNLSNVPDMDVAMMANADTTIPDGGLGVDYYGDGRLEVFDPVSSQVNNAAPSYTPGTDFTVRFSFDGSTLSAECSGVDGFATVSMATADTAGTWDEFIIAINNNNISLSHTGSVDNLIQGP